MEREKRGCLTVKGRKFYVYDGLNTIGRDKQATVIVKDLGVSQQQAILTIVDETRHFISDFNSSNGTHINSEKLVPYKLYEIKDGSVIFFSVDVEATYRKISNNELSDTEEVPLQDTQIDDSFFTQKTQFFDIASAFEGKATTSKYAIQDDGLDFNSIITQKLIEPNNANKPVIERGSTEADTLGISNASSAARFNDNMPSLSCSLENKNDGVQSGATEISSAETETRVNNISSTEVDLSISSNKVLSQIEVPTVNEPNSEQSISLHNTNIDTVLSENSSLNNYQEIKSDNSVGTTILPLSYNKDPLITPDSSALVDEQNLNIVLSDIQKNNSDNSVLDDSDSPLKAIGIHHENNSITLPDDQKQMPTSSMALLEDPKAIQIVSDAPIHCNDQNDKLSSPAIKSDATTFSSHELKPLIVLDSNDQKCKPNSSDEPKPDNTTPIFDEQKQESVSSSATPSNDQIHKPNLKLRSGQKPKPNPSIVSDDMKPKLDPLMVSVDIIHLVDQKPKPDPSTALTDKTELLCNKENSSKYTIRDDDYDFTSLALTQKLVSSNTHKENIDANVSSASIMTDGDDDGDEKKTQLRVIPKDAKGNNDVPKESSTVKNDPIKDHTLNDQPETLNSSVFVIPDDGYDFKSVEIKGNEKPSDESTHAEKDVTLPKVISDMSKDDSLEPKVLLTAQFVDVSDDEAGDDIYDMPTQVLQPKSPKAEQKHDEIYDLPTQLLPKTDVSSDDLVKPTQSTKVESANSSNLINTGDQNVDNLVEDIPNESNNSAENISPTVTQTENIADGLSEVIDKAELKDISAGNLAESEVLAVNAPDIPTNTLSESNLKVISQDATETGTANNCGTEKVVKENKGIPIPKLIKVNNSEAEKDVHEEQGNTKCIKSDKSTVEDTDEDKSYHLDDDSPEENVEKSSDSNNLQESPKPDVSNQTKSKDANEVSKEFVDSKDQTPIQESKLSELVGSKEQLLMQESNDCKSSYNRKENLEQELPKSDLSNRFKFEDQPAQTSSETKNCDLLESESISVGSLSDDKSKKFLNESENTSEENIQDLMPEKDLQVVQDTKLVITENITEDDGKTDILKPEEVGGHDTQIDKSYSEACVHEKNVDSPKSSLKNIPALSTEPKISDSKKDTLIFKAKSCDLNPENINDDILAKSCAQKGTSNSKELKGADDNANNSILNDSSNTLIENDIIERSLNDEVQSPSISDSASKSLLDPETMQLFDIPKDVESSTETVEHDLPIETSTIGKLDAEDNIKTPNGEGNTNVLESQAEVSKTSLDCDNDINPNIHSLNSDDEIKNVKTEDFSSTSTDNEKLEDSSEKTNINTQNKITEDTESNPNNIKTLKEIDKNIDSSSTEISKIPQDYKAIDFNNKSSLEENSSRSFEAIGDVNSEAIPLFSLKSDNEVHTAITSELLLKPTEEVPTVLTIDTSKSCEDIPSKNTLQSREGALLSSEDISSENTQVSGQTDTNEVIQISPESPEVVSLHDSKTDKTELASLESRDNVALTAIDESGDAISLESKTNSRMNVVSVLESIEDISSDEEVHVSVETPSGINLVGNALIIQKLPQEDIHVDNYVLSGGEVTTDVTEVDCKASTDQTVVVSVKLSDIHNFQTPMEVVSDKISYVDEQNSESCVAEVSSQEITPISPETSSDATVGQIIVSLESSEVEDKDNQVVQESECEIVHDLSKSLKDVHSSNKDVENINKSETYVSREENTNISSSAESSKMAHIDNVDPDKSTSGGTDENIILDKDILVNSKTIAEGDVGLPKSPEEESSNQDKPTIIEDTSISAKSLEVAPISVYEVSSEKAIDEANSSGATNPTLESSKQGNLIASEDITKTDSGDIEANILESSEKDNQISETNSDQCFNEIGTTVKVKPSEHPSTSLEEVVETSCVSSESCEKILTDENIPKNISTESSTGKGCHEANDVFHEDRHPGDEINLNKTFSHESLADNSADVSLKPARKDNSDTTADTLIEVVLISSDEEGNSKNDEQLIITPPSNVESFTKDSIHYGGDDSEATTLVSEAPSLLVESALEANTNKTIQVSSNEVEANPNKTIQICSSEGEGDLIKSSDNTPISEEEPSLSYRTARDSLESPEEVSSSDLPVSSKLSAEGTTHISALILKGGDDKLDIANPTSNTEENNTSDTPIVSSREKSDAKNISVPSNKDTNNDTEIYSDVKFKTSSTEHSSISSNEKDIPSTISSKDEDICLKSQDETSINVDIVANPDESIPGPKHETSNEAVSASADKISCIEAKICNTLSPSEGNSNETTNKAKDIIISIESENEAKCSKDETTQLLHDHNNDESNETVTALNPSVSNNVISYDISSPEPLTVSKESEEASLVFESEEEISLRKGLIDEAIVSLESETDTSDSNDGSEINSNVYSEDIPIVIEDIDESNLVTHPKPVGEVDLDSTKVSSVSLFDETSSGKAEKSSPHVFDASHSASDGNNLNKTSSVSMEVLSGEDFPIVQSDKTDSSIGFCSKEDVVEATTHESHSSIKDVIENNPDQKYASSDEKVDFKSNADKITPLIPKDNSSDVLASPSTENETKSSENVPSDVSTHKTNTTEIEARMDISTNTSLVSKHNDDVDKVTSDSSQEEIASSNISPQSESKCKLDEPVGTSLESSNDDCNLTSISETLPKLISDKTDPSIILVDQPISSHAPIQAGNNNSDECLRNDNNLLDTNTSTVTKPIKDSQGLIYSKTIESNEVGIETTDNTDALSSKSSDESSHILPKPGDEAISDQTPLTKPTIVQPESSEGSSNESEKCDLVHGLNKNQNASRLLKTDNGGIEANRADQTSFANESNPDKQYEEALSPISVEDSHIDVESQIKEDVLPKDDIISTETPTVGDDLNTISSVSNFDKVQEKNTDETTCIQLEQNASLEPLNTTNSKNTTDVQDVTKSSPSSSDEAQTISDPLPDSDAVVSIKKIDSIQESNDDVDMPSSASTTCSVTVDEVTITKSVNLTSPSKSCSDDSLVIDDDSNKEEIASSSENLDATFSDISGNQLNSGTVTEVASLEVDQIQDEGSSVTTQLSVSDDLTSPETDNNNANSTDNESIFEETNSSSLPISPSVVNVDNEVNPEESNPSAALEACAGEIDSTYSTNSANESNSEVTNKLTYSDQIISVEADNEVTSECSVMPSSSSSSELRSDKVAPIETDDISPSSETYSNKIISIESPNETNLVERDLSSCADNDVPSSSIPIDEVLSVETNSDNKFKLSPQDTNMSQCLGQISSLESNTKFNTEEENLPLTSETYSNVSSLESDNEADSESVTPWSSHDEVRSSDTANEDNLERLPLLSQSTSNNISSVGPNLPSSSSSSESCDAICSNNVVSSGLKPNDDTNSGGASFELSCSDGIEIASNVTRVKTAETCDVEVNVENAALIESSETGESLLNTDGDVDVGSEKYPISDTNTDDKENNATATESCDDICSNIVATVDKTIITGGLENSKTCLVSVDLSKTSGFSVESDGGAKIEQTNNILLVESTDDTEDIITETETKDKEKTKLSDNPEESKLASESKACDVTSVSVETERPSESCDVISSDVSLETETIDSDHKINPTHSSNEAACVSLERGQISTLEDKAIASVSTTTTTQGTTGEQNLDSTTSDKVASLTIDSVSFKIEDSGSRTGIDSLENEDVIIVISDDDNDEYHKIAPLTEPTVETISDDETDIERSNDVSSSDKLARINSHPSSNISLPGSIIPLETNDDSCEKVKSASLTESCSNSEETPIKIDDEVNLEGESHCSSLEIEDKANLDSAKFTSSSKVLNKDENLEEDSLASLSKVEDLGGEKHSLLLETAKETSLGGEVLASPIETDDKINLEAENLASIPEIDNRANIQRDDRANTHPEDIGISSGEEREKFDTSQEIIDVSTSETDDKVNFKAESLASSLETDDKDNICKEKGGSSLKIEDIEERKLALSPKIINEEKNPSLSENNDRKHLEEENLSTASENDNKDNLKEVYPRPSSEIVNVEDKKLATLVEINNTSKLEGDGSSSSLEALEEGKLVLSSETNLALLSEADDKEKTSPKTDDLEVSLRKIDDGCKLEEGKPALVPVIDNKTDLAKEKLTSSLETDSEANLDKQNLATSSEIDKDNSEKLQTNNPDNLEGEQASLLLGADEKVSLIAKSFTEPLKSTELANLEEQNFSTSLETDREKPSTNDSVKGKQDIDEESNSIAESPLKLTEVGNLEKQNLVTDEETKPEKLLTDNSDNLEGKQTSLSLGVDEKTSLKAESCTSTLKSTEIANLEEVSSSDILVTTVIEEEVKDTDELVGKIDNNKDNLKGGCFSSRVEDNAKRNLEEKDITSNITVKSKLTEEKPEVEGKAATEEEKVVSFLETEEKPEAEGKAAIEEEKVVDKKESNIMSSKPDDEKSVQLLHIDEKSNSQDKLVSSSENKAAIEEIKSKGAETFSNFDVNMCKIKKDESVSKRKASEAFKDDDDDNGTSCKSTNRNIELIDENIEECTSVIVDDSKKDMKSCCNTEDKYNEKIPDESKKIIPTEESRESDNLNKTYNRNEDNINNDAEVKSLSKNNEKVPDESKKVVPTESCITFELGNLNKKSEKKETLGKVGVKSTALSLIRNAYYGSDSEDDEADDDQNLENKPEHSGTIREKDNSSNESSDMCSKDKIKELENKEETEKQIDVKIQSSVSDPPPEGLTNFESKTQSDDKLVNVSLGLGSSTQNLKSSSSEENVDGSSNKDSELVIDDLASKQIDVKKHKDKEGVNASGDKLMPQSSLELGSNLGDQNLKSSSEIVKLPDDKIDMNKTTSVDKDNHLSKVSITEDNLNKDTTVDDISFEPKVSTEVSKLNDESVGNIVIEREHGLKSPNFKITTESGGSTDFEKSPQISRSDLNDTNINSTLQNTQMDDNFYAASTQLFNDNTFSTNKSNKDDQQQTASKDDTIFAIPDDGFDFNLVNTQKLKDLQSIPSTSTKTDLDIHNLPTQCKNTSSNTSTIHDLPTQLKPSEKNVTFSDTVKSSQNISSIHDLPTQVNVSKTNQTEMNNSESASDISSENTQTNPLDIHDMPTQIMDTDMSSENTEENPLDLHSMPTQLIIPPKELEEVETSIFDAETQISDKPTDTASIKDDDEPVTSENQDVESDTKKAESDDDATQVYHPENLQANEASTKPNLHTNDASADQNQMNEDDDATQVYQPENIQTKEASTDSDNTQIEEVAESTSPIPTDANKTPPTTLPDSDNQSQLPMHLLKTRTTKRLTSNDIESTSSNDDGDNVQIEPVESPKSNTNSEEPVESQLHTSGLKRRVQNRIVSDDETQIDDSSNDSVNFLATAHSTLTNHNDSDPQSQLPLHLLKKRTSKRLNSNDIEELNESKENDDVLKEEKLNEQKENDDVLKEETQEVNVSKSENTKVKTGNESDSHTDIETPESPPDSDSKLKKRTTNRLDSDEIKKLNEPKDNDDVLEKETQKVGNSNVQTENESDSHTDIEPVESPAESNHQDSDPQPKGKPSIPVREDGGSSSSDFEETNNKAKRKKSMKTRKERDIEKNITPRTYSRLKSPSTAKKSDSDTDIEPIPKTSIIADDSDSNTDVEGNVNHNMTTSILSATDIEDSFVKRRSFLDVSNDVIPATQDMVNTSRASFAKDLSTVLDVTNDEITENNKDNTCSEISFKLGLTQEEEEIKSKGVYVVQGLEDDSGDSFDFGGPTQKMDAPNLDKDDDDFDFAGPTQKIPEKDDIFDDATQKVDSEVFKRPLEKQSIVKTSLRHDNSGADLDDSDLFIAPTQVIDSDNNKRTENLDDSEVFIAATQKIDIDNSSKNANDSDIFCAATQKMDSSLDKSEKMDDTLFSAATQKVDFVESAPTTKSKNVDQDDDNDSIFLAATQVPESNQPVPPPPPRNISTQDTVTVADSDSFNLGDDEKELNTSTSSDLSEGKKKRVSFGKVVDIESLPLAEIIRLDEANKRREMENEALNKNKNIDTESNVNDLINKDLNSEGENKNKDVESQMEVMFATQTVHLTESDPKRPNNPVEKALLDCSTQDVIESLTKEDSSSKATPRRSRRNSKCLEELDEPPKRRRTRKASTDKKETTEVVCSSNIISTLKTIPEVTKAISSPRKSKLATIQQSGVDEEKEDDTNIDEYESDLPVETNVIQEHTEQTLPQCSKSLVMEEPSPIVENRRPIRERKKKYESLDEDYFSMPIKKRQMRSDYDDLLMDRPARKRTSRKKDESGEGKSTRGRSTRGNKKTSDAEVSAEIKALAQQSTTSGDDTESSSIVASKEKVPKKAKAERISKKRKSSDSDDDCLITISVPKKQKHITISDDSSDDKCQQTLLDVSAKKGGVKTEAQSSMSLLSTPERAKRKLKPKVVFTMFESVELSSLVRALGGMMVDSIDLSTVLVTKNILRTQKLLCAVGQCKPICSPSWLLECKKAHTFLDPWDFLIEDQEAEKKWNFSLKESYSRSKCKKLFDGYSFHVVATRASDVLKAAIESSGGKCVSKTPKVGNFIVVAAEENRAKCTKYFKQGVKVVLPEAVFDGVLRQDIVFDKHLLT